MTTNTRKKKRANTGATATKWFITAASVAGMLGGWVAFSSQPANGVDPASQILTVDLGLEPIPTVVPAPNITRTTTQMDSPAPASQSSSSTLRTVTAPRPVPITRTRSSR